MLYTKPYITINTAHTFTKRKDLYNLLPLVEEYNLMYQRKCIISSTKRNTKNFFTELNNVSNLKNIKTNFDAICFYKNDFGVNFYNAADERMYVSAPNISNNSIANLPSKKIAIFTFEKTKTNGKQCTLYKFRGVFDFNSYDNTKQQWILIKKSDNMTWEY